MAMREPYTKLFVRVETYNLDEKRTQGGYICATETIMALKLGVSPDCTDEEWANLIEQSDDPEVHEWGGHSEERAERNLSDILVFWRIFIFCDAVFCTIVLCAILNHAIREHHN